MLIVSYLSWWYGRGFAGQVKIVQDIIAKVVDQFSIGQLVLTLFAPFKQIDAGRARGSTSLDVKFRVWLDQLFSRFFGAFIRFFTILLGGLMIVAVGVVGLLRLIVWPLLPLLPLAGLFLSLIGWLPWK